MNEHPWTERERLNPLPDMHGRKWGRWELDARRFYLTAQGKPWRIDLSKIDSRPALTSLIRNVHTYCDYFDKEHVVEAVLALAGVDDQFYICGPLSMNLPRQRLIEPLPPPLDQFDIGRVSGVYAFSTSKAVKIGRASDIFKRRDALQTGSSERLDVVAILSTDPREETLFHCAMGNARIQGGEWFHLGEQVAIHVRRARSAPQPGAIELTKETFR